MIIFNKISKLSLIPIYIDKKKFEISLIVNRRMKV